MSDNRIPEAAVEAAHKAWREQAALDGSIFEYNLRAALEAAAPHIMREAHDAGSKVAWAAAEPIFKADGWDEGYAAGLREEQPAWTKNPYRPTP